MTQDRFYARQKGISLWAVLIILVVLAALAAGGWWGWQQYQRFQQERTELSERLDNLESGVSRDQESVQDRLGKLKQEQAKLTDQVARSREALADLRSGGEQMWLINEARALASLASQRLLLTQDANAAKRLLKAADETLARVDDPAILPARKALALDMEKLSSADNVDVQGLVLRLGALRDLVAELAVPAQEAPPERQQPDDEQSWWQDIVDRLPVQVRQHDGAVPLPLSADQATLVRLTLDGSIQQAQLALMQGRAKAYRQALKNARATLNQWFHKNDPQAAHLDLAFQELTGQPVRQALPEIGAGLAAIELLKREEGKQ